MRTAATLLLAFGTTQAPAVQLSAQHTEQVSGEVTCGECVITLDTVVTIGGLDGPGVDLISEVSRVAVDQNARLRLRGCANRPVPRTNLVRHRHERR